MKRVLTFLAIMLLPLSLMAMTPISDNDMSKVTGQAGVSMTFDVTLNMTFGQLGWGDSDNAGLAVTFPDPLIGTMTGLQGGWVGIDNLDISTLHIWPRTDYTMESANTGSGDWDDLKWLTIDVIDVTGARGAGLAEMAFGDDNPGHLTAVAIGIPTLTMTMTSMSGNVVLGDRTSGGTVGGQVNGQFYDIGDYKETQKPNFDQLLGRFYVGGLNMATGGGQVLIFAHGHHAVSNAENELMYGSGVSLLLTDVTISYLLLDEAAWGDIDGAYTASDHEAYSNVNTGAYGTGLSNPGWVGIADLAIENVVINGLITIDVGSYQTDGTDQAKFDTGTLDFHQLIPAFDDAFAWKAAHEASGFNAIGGSFIFIGLQKVSIDMDKMYGVVKLSSGDLTPNLAGSSQVLGDIYVGGMHMGIEESEVTGCPSWFAVFAH